MKRLNVKLTIWLLVITVISVAGVHLLHGFQVGRNADFLRVQAEQAKAKGDIKEAIKQYNQYLNYRDDPDGYVALSELVVDVAKGAEATVQDKRRAYAMLEEAIRRHQDLHSVRRRLIDYTIAGGRFIEAIDHIKYLEQNGVNDPELQVKLARCQFTSGEAETAFKTLCGIVGYDEKTEQFVNQPPPGGKEVSAFQMLAGMMRRRGGDSAKQADAIMSQMIAWNPESSKRI